MTVGGGEPLMQADFVEALFRACREEKIHTCMDTCGYAHPESLEKVLDHTNLVFFDLKVIDPSSHFRVTGKSNALTLENAGIIAKKKVPVVFRVPLIPGFTD